MAKTGQNAEVYRNNYWVLRFMIVDEDDPAEPPLDLTNLTVFYSIAKLSTSGSPIVASPLVDVNSDDDPTVVVITDAVNGEVEVRLLATVTNTLAAPKDYYQELEVVDPFDNPVVTATGTLSVLPNVVNA